MSEAQSQPQDATAALQELEDQLAGGKKAAAPVSAAAAVAAAAATAAVPAPVEEPIVAPAPPKPEVPEPAPPKKKAKTRRTFFEGGQSRTLTKIRRRFKELVDALGSSDLPTRKGARLFFASLVGLVLVSGVASHRYWGHIKELRARAARLARQQ